MVNIQYKKPLRVFGVITLSILMLVTTILSATTSAETINKQTISDKKDIKIEEITIDPKKEDIEGTEKDLKDSEIKIEPCDLFHDPDGGTEGGMDDFTDWLYFFAAIITVVIYPLYAIDCLFLDSKIMHTTHDEAIDLRDIDGDNR